MMALIESPYAILYLCKVMSGSGPVWHRSGRTAT